MSSQNPLSKVGPRRGVMQIVPSRGSVRPAVLHDDQRDLVTQPLEVPTGPGGAAGFRNVAGSQIAVPQVTNVYLGAFWGDRSLVEAFSKAVVENGYLDPLRELHYGTGSGRYLGSIDGPELKPNSDFRDSDARAVVAQLVDQKRLGVDENSLVMLILPSGVTSVFDGDGSRSCQAFCGYHDAFEHNSIEIAYGVLPSALCKGCGGQIEDFTAVYAHELAEATTDKVPGQGWVAADGQENGDLEAWILIGWGPPSDSKRYTVQGYYTNERGNTVGVWRVSPGQTPATMRPDLTPELCEAIVIRNTPFPGKLTDPSQPLSDGGVIDDVSANMHRTGIQQDLRRIQWQIKRVDIDSGPAVTVDDSAISVMNNAF